MDDDRPGASTPVNHLSHLRCFTQDTNISFIQVSHSLYFLEFRSSEVTGVQTIVLKALFTSVYRVGSIVWTPVTPELHQLTKVELVLLAPFKESRLKYRLSLDLWSLCLQRTPELLATPELL